MKSVLTKVSLAQKLYICFWKRCGLSPRWISEAKIVLYLYGLPWAGKAQQMVDLNWIENPSWPFNALDVKDACESCVACSLGLSIVSPMTVQSCHLLFPSGGFLNSELSERVAATSLPGNKASCKLQGEAESWRTKSGGGHRKLEFRDANILKLSHALRK